MKAEPEKIIPRKILMFYVIYSTMYLEMKIPFDIKYRPQIESGKYAVFTDCGEPVEIVKWDCKGNCPILAVIDDGDTHDCCFFKSDYSAYLTHI